MRVADFARDWPYSHPRATHETNVHYRHMVRRFVERFGDRALTSVTTAEVQVWGMQNLSAVRYVRAMFSDAILDGHLTVNPLAKVKVPRAPRRRRDDEVPTKEEVEILLAAAGDQLAAVIALGAIVGLRQSEILALGYLGLRPDLTSAYVHQQLGRNGAMKPIKGKVKAREVNVFRWARPYLEAWSNRADADDHVVVGPLNHAELRPLWDDLRERTGITCEFHQLRTFCAVWMLELGASPIDVAVQLHGHTDPTVVLSYYAMIDKGKALARLRRVMDGDA